MYICLLVCYCNKYNFNLATVQWQGLTCTYIFHSYNTQVNNGKLTSGDLYMKNHAHIST